MHYSHCSPKFAQAVVLAASIFLACSNFAFAQESACPAASPHAPSVAETAISNGDLQKAADLYSIAVTQHPQDADAAAGYVRVLLSQGEFDKAAELADKTASSEPHSAAAQTALAEVQLKRGLPWLSMKTLDLAAAADPCYARAHLIRSRVLRLYSMHSSERDEVAKAYAIDPSDSDIQQAWFAVVSPAHEAESIVKSLETQKDLDAATRQKADQTARTYLSLLQENSQTCGGVPTADSAELPIQASKADGKHIDGYQMDVKFSAGMATMRVDTAASGMFVSRALADLNGLKPGVDDPPGTVRVERVQIGPLEFRDCLVGVSEAPFPNKADGSIGTDIFSQYLITLDLYSGKLLLKPLPAVAGILPGDRTAAQELTGFTPIYHRRQYLLVPVTVDDKAERLFLLDTGTRLSAMTPELAHAVSTTKMNFTQSLDTESGPKAQVYRDAFSFQFGGQNISHQERILQMGHDTLDRNAGLEVAGKLGFDLLHSMVLQLDYRDGLVKFEAPEEEIAHKSSKESRSGNVRAEDSEPACPQFNPADRPIASTLEVQMLVGLDAGHLKQGKEFYGKTSFEWTDPQCSLAKDATVYGHVTGVSAPKNGPVELSLIFDHADCLGHDKKPLGFRLLGIVSSHSANPAMHDAIPTEVRGGARQIPDAATAAGGYDPELNPSGVPHTVHPGVVLGMADMKLEPLGGAACSDRISTAGKSLNIPSGSKMILEREAP